MTHTIFPESSFPQDRSLKDLFRERSYGFKDIKSLRTSLHYSRSEAEGPWFKYDVAIGNATRQEDGTFHVFVIRSGISENTIDHIFSGTASKHAEDEPTITCSAAEVFEVMDTLEKKLAKESFRSLPYPRNAPLRIHDDIHFRVASWLCYAEKEQQQPSFTKENVLRQQRSLYFQMR